MALKPSTIEELRERVTDAAAAGRRLEIRGGGSKAEIGAPREAEILDLSGFSRVVDYDPGELVLTTEPGVRLVEIEALLAEHGQMLAFEPYDHGPLLGAPPGGATIGGVVMAGVAGSQRLSMGSARDHLLGFEAVSGQGQSFVGGAKVVKNVTGFDLPKVMAGSWGRLAAVTALTLRVVPRPQARTTLALTGLADVQAQTAMALAMGSPAEVAAAAHLPSATTGEQALTVFRLQGFAPSVAARFDLLARTLAQEGKAERLEAARADRVWQSLRDLAPLADGRPLWRLSVAPSCGPAAVADVADREARYLYDWAGGLVWLASTAEPVMVRRAAVAAGGHATLVRASAGLRARVPTQHPPTRGVAALSDRVRRAFDPLGVFETGRFLDGTHAD